ncbi:MULTISPECIES: tetratricopeptide repeat-containing sulfotransferase family protein [unclassified Ruegeria]|uniref:tetratricopeptide repeat-containing sulfotransferase family protein n=1 Tax=unclassified Ruegeria TaxID=2625375 RepID=UPI001487FC24|nr:MULTISPECIES: tetratricopeptide repeat-containing sulfotransferase family protein [unclassified Ruegeria]NOD35977.1 tetratricopeptide repeat protein [Ruegeria sp. HKCCD7296]NOE43369.1 tetratricopeptide repeat protein [Ruegeria sp. HKCCD7319]
MKNQTAQTLKSKAISLLETGKLQQALKKAQFGVKKFPKDSDFHAIAGFVLTELKQYKKSIPHFLEASRKKPDDPQFAENLANALMQTGQITRALTYAEQKVEQFPNNKELRRVIDEIQREGRNWRSIVEFTTHSLASDPNNPELLAKRARAYLQMGFVEESTRDIERAYDLAPENIMVAFQKSLNLHHSGDKEMAFSILNDILNTQPHHANALLQAATMASKENVPQLMSAVEAAAAEKDEPLQELEFAKAHLVQKTDGIAAALPQFAKANAVQHDAVPYDFAAEEEKLHKIIELFPEGTSSFEGIQSEAPLPIFVIGQPRSGTTLMEMMLSSAPDIAGCGELMLIPELTNNFHATDKVFDAEAAKDIARSYRENMPNIPENSIGFVDKLPHNYQRVGFILAAFPNAKIVNMLRDPRDVGLSKWIRRFPAGGMNYASSLDAIAHSANLYRRYIAHWDTVFEGKILTLPYEELVADPKTHSQRVAEFCGVDWHESMVHPEKNTKQVRTASVDQVRSKISTKSIGGWREVADHITAMLDGFDPKLWPEYDFS